MEDATCFLPFDTEPSSPDHSEGYCERCQELSEPCYLGETKKSEIQKRLDCSPVTSIFRQVSHNIASYIQKHKHLLYELLKDMWVKINFHIEDLSGFIHILPTRNSITIENWNKICEKKLDDFLKDLDSRSLSLQPELLPRLQEIIKEVKSDASLHVEEQTLFQMVGESQVVKETLEDVRQIAYTQKKPCIIPF